MNKEDYLPPTLPTLAVVEMREIGRHLRFNNFNMSHAAKSLGISLKTLYNKIHLYKWNLQEMRDTWLDRLKSDEERSVSPTMEDFGPTGILSSGAHPLDGGHE